MNDKAFVEVEINGENKLMKFGFNAIADVEEHFGKGISHVMNEENIGFRTIRALYWAGLRWKDKGITIDRVGQILEDKLDEGHTFNELMEPVKKALQNSKIFKRKDESAEASEGTESKN